MTLGQNYRTDCMTNLCRDSQEKLKKIIPIIKHLKLCVKPTSRDTASLSKADASRVDAFVNILTLYM